MYCQMRACLVHPYRSLFRASAARLLSIAAFAAAVCCLAAPQVRALPDSDTEYLTHLATCLEEMKAGSLMSANQTLAAAMEHRRDECLAYAVRAVLLTQSADFAEAGKAFDEAQKMKADPAFCAYGKAVCRMGLADLQGALEALPAQAGGCVTADDLRLFRAYVSLLQGDRVNLDLLFSMDARVKEMKAWRLLRDGQTQDALRLLQDVPATDPLGPALDDGVAMSFDPASPVFVSSSVSGAHRPGAGLRPMTGFSGQVRLRADRSKTPSAGYVLYYVDETLLGIVNTPPFELVWDTTRCPNGVHTVRVRGEGSDGSLAGESITKVMVSNQAPEPAEPLQGAAADRLMQAAWQALSLKSCRTWAEYEMGKAQQAQGARLQAMLHYERILAFRPYYRDVQGRWIKLAALKPGMPIWKGSGEDRAMALTFDDGPNGGTASLLDALSASDAKATFFVVGAQARRHPDLIQEMVRQGHELACHSETHCSLSNLTEEDVIRELFGPIAIIHELTGKVPVFFRPPGGHIDAAVRKVAWRFGLTPVMWSAHCGPYEGGPVGKMEQYVAQSVGAGDVLLMHNCEATTLQAIPVAVATIHAKGLKMTGISSLRRRSANAQ